MENYVILNGEDSRFIDGLLIQELPPITKPKLRVETEEIDGRDGDIITPLGYSAYDRELKIGLYGDYNIDDIITYFDGSGEATFSNEPEKIYNYQIIEQIDFNRLLRFKTATVKFHVQPFKHAYNDTFTTDYGQTSSADTEAKTITIFNRGNCVSRPAIRVHGWGNFTIKVNEGRDVLTVNFNPNIIHDIINIDSEKMEAWEPRGLANRRVAGDYEKFFLNPGKNTLTIDAKGVGHIEKITITNYTRWI